MILVLLLPAAIFAVTLAAAIAARIFKTKAVFEGWMFFGFILGPVLGIIPFMAQAQSTVADRYVYLAWLGPVLGLAALATRYNKFKIGLSLLLCLWATLSFERSKIWRDSDTR